MAEIHKAAAIIIKNRRLLLERSKDKPFFIGPGGKLEPGETTIQALIRELKEEINITVSPASLEPFGSYTAEAANHPGSMMYMEVFMVKTWQGDITPGSEVEELRWVTANPPADMPIGSVYGKTIIPHLKKLGMID